MTNWLMVKIAVTSLVVSFSGQAYCEKSNRELWFSRYGPSGYGRHISEGKDLGELSLVQCSRFCSDDITCMALQFYKTGVKIGKCYTFSSYTYNTAMIASPGHLYMEKRNCLEPVHFTAVIMYPGERILVLFSPQYTYVYAVITVVDNAQTYMTFQHSKAGSHQLIFPGLTGEVDAAFVGPSGYTFLVQGSLLRCYMPVNADKTLFEVCQPNAIGLNILINYFSVNARLDGLVSVDNTSNIVYVMKDNVVYKLLWSGSVYDINDTFNITDVNNVENIWSNAPYDITAISRFVNPDTYLLVEDTKLILYDSGPKMVSSIFRIC